MVLYRRKYFHLSVKIFLLPFERNNGWYYKLYEKKNMFLWHIKYIKICPFIEVL